MRRLLAGLAVVFATAGCGGSADELTVYLPQRLGPDGPPGQISRVLMPVARDVREHIPAARQAVLELRLGPSPDERARGFADALEPTTRLVDVSLRGETARVELAGAEPTIAGTAAIVYSVTEATGARLVRLRLDGRACCAYDRRNRALSQVTRDAFRGWSGEPCSERTWKGAVRCRRDGESRSGAATEESRFVTVWGRAAPIEAPAGGLLKALRHWKVVSTPPPEPFVTLELRAGSRRIPVVFAPRARAVAGAGSAGTGGLVWLALDERAVRELAPAVERQDPYVTAGWPIGLKAPSPLRSELQALGPS